MTAITPNTFNGPNQANSVGYIPQTTIESAKVDADLNQILTDLDYHLSLLQTAFAKLDQIDLEQLGDMTAAEIVPIINASGLKIDADNLENTVIIDSELTAAIVAHKNTVVSTDMHSETTIKSTELGYSNTPTSLLTTCANLLDELKNIRYQIHRLNGRTNWSDTPSASLTELYVSLSAAIGNLTSHINSSMLHLSTNGYNAIAASHSPSTVNPFATINDVSGLGNGDMNRSVYDTNVNGIVDKSEALVSGSTIKTYTDIVSKISGDIAIHGAISSAHHARYTNAEAIGAINSDTDHSSTARHCYTDLICKPAADRFTSTDVTNLRANSLCNGSKPWTTKADLLGGLVVGTQLPNVMVMPYTWNEDVQTKGYYTSSTPGYAEATFTGPLMILSGFAVRTTSYAYVQVSVNGGTTWVNCEVSPAFANGPDVSGDTIKMWTCPPMYIPANRSFKIKVGSSFGPNGCTNEVYGGAFHIQYRALSY